MPGLLVPSTAFPWLKPWRAARLNQGSPLSSASPAVLRRRVRCRWSPPSRAMLLDWIIAPPLSESESRQALRAVVGDGDTGNLLKRAVWPRGVPPQLRGVPVDLVEIGAIWRNPAIARAAADI